MPDNIYSNEIILFAVSCTFLAFSNYFCCAFQYTVYIYAKCFAAWTAWPMLDNRFTNSRDLCLVRCVCVCICVCFTLIFIYINNVSYRLFKYFPNGTIWMTKALLMHDGRVDYIQMDEQFELFCLWVFFANNEIAIKKRMMIFQLEQYQ